VSEQFAVLVDGLRGARVLPIDAEGFSGLSAVNDAGATVVVWSDGSAAALPLTMPEGTTVVRGDGTTAEVGGTAPQVDSSPVILQIPAASADDLADLVG
jgi:hypothetical protein